MNHGRSIAAACALALIASQTTAFPADSPFKITCGIPDHPSGLYYVKADAKVTITVDNTSTEPRQFSGEIGFGPLLDNAAIKPLSVTPVQPATIAPGQRVKIPLTVTFGAAGEYRLNWRHDNIDTPIPFAEDNAGVGLRAIFAPRPAPAKPEESPWLALLPLPAVNVPGFLTDYIQQTTVRRFLIDDRFAYDARTNIGLGFAASTGAGAEDIDSLLAEAAKAKAQFLLRVTVPLADAADPRVISAFKAYIFDAVRRSRGTLSSIAITPDLPPNTPSTDAHRAAYRAFYLAAYESAKRADKNIQLLGAGSAQATESFLLRPDPRLISYLDALALADAAAEPALANTLLAGKKLPLYILPPAAGKPAPPAAALAQHAAIVPIPSPATDNGVTAHLLNGTVFFQRLSIAVPTADPTTPDKSPIPYIALFQGDGYSIAAIAGFAAGTELDAQFPALARTPTLVEPLKPGEKPFPNLQVGDDTRSMRVVDAAGAPVDCRVGDSIYVPAEDAVVYLLQAGSAQDLAGTLLPSTPNRLPVLAIDATQKPDSLRLHLHNISAHPQSGTLRLLRPSPDNQPATPPTLLAEKDLPALGPDKESDLPFTTTAPLTGTLVIEISTPSLTQRTAITLP